MTFSGHAFGTKPVESMPRAGDAALGPEASDAQKEAFGQSELGTELAGTMAATYQDTLAEREHDHRSVENASSKEIHTANALSPSSATGPSTLLNMKGDDAPGAPFRVQPSSTETSSIDDASDADYLPSTNPEDTNEHEISTTETNEVGKEISETHVPLGYQISEDVLRAAMAAPENSKASFWSSNLYRGPEGKRILVHYCKTKEISERVAQYFANEKVLGFDIEWKPYAHPESIKKNVSLIQLACEDRIALFHVARFTEKTAAQLMPPTLKAILEAPDVYKVGVAVKGDFTRLAKFLDVEPQGVFELSRLHNLVQFTGTETKITNKLVGLAAQVKQHLQLPLYKGGQLIDDPEDSSNVRSSDWSLELNFQQIHYAAADAYAGFRLYDILEEKRKKLKPTPSRPLVCDYDSKPAPRSDKPKKKRKIIAKVDDAAAADVNDTTASMKEEQEKAEEVDEGSKESQETEGYETAQEELVDSHQLEGEDPDSSQDSHENSSESEDDLFDPVPQAKEENSAARAVPKPKRLGRIGLNRLKGLDPNYPILPDVRGSDELNSSSDEDEDLVDMETSGEEKSDGSNISVEALMEASEPESDIDEFSDSELEEALDELSIDSNGRLQEATDSTAPSESFALPKQADASPKPDLDAEQVQVAKDAKDDDMSSESEQEQHLIDLLHDPEIAEYLHSSNLTASTATPAPLPLPLPQATLSSPNPSHDTTQTTPYSLATSWASTYLLTTIPSPTSPSTPHIRATIPHLRAYHLWAYQSLSVAQIAALLRDPPLAEATVGSYILQAIVLEGMDVDAGRVRGVLMGLPVGMRKGRWRALAGRVGAL